HTPKGHINVLVMVKIFDFGYHRGYYNTINYIFKVVSRETSLFMSKKKKPTEKKASLQWVSIKKIWE
ncbi:MAG: hypothetical protein RSC41_02515, partial [Oscillospiraceae bacterium]